MATGIIMVNTNITKTSGLFMIKKGCPVWVQGRAHRKGLHTDGLLWFHGRSRAKKYLCRHGHAIYRVKLPKRDPGNDVCGIITPYMPYTFGAR